MYKEIIFSVIIITIIFIGDFITHDYTNKTVSQLTDSLTDFKNSILSNDNYNKLQDKIYNITSSWENQSEKFAYYIEHNELEKVETSLTTMNSFLCVNEPNNAIAELDKASYLLEHIKDKYAFNLENVF